MVLRSGSGNQAEYVRTAPELHLYSLHANSMCIAAEVAKCKVCRAA